MAVSFLIFRRSRFDPRPGPIEIQSQIEESNSLEISIETMEFLLFNSEVVLQGGFILGSGMF